MKIKFDLVQCTFVLCLVKYSLQECGKALEQGTVMCNLFVGFKKFKGFDFKLCTHGVLATWGLHCENDVCKFLKLSDIEERIDFALPNLPETLGIFFRIDETVKNYLFGNKLRCSKTIDELVKFMKDKRLAFVVVNNNANKLLNTSDDQHNYFLFLKELAEKLHDRGYHLGQSTDVDIELVTNFNETEVFKLADWFFTPLRPDSDHLTPLTNTYGKSEWTTTYSLEKVLQFIKPGCLVVDLGPRLTTHRAIETAVQPGPGSSSKILKSGDLHVSKVCYRLHNSGDACQEFWDEESSSPWTACRNDYYTYDNAQSLTMKADLVKQYNITGVMLWDDDITALNLCNNGDPLANYRAVQGIRRK